MSVIDEVKARLDIVDLVGEQVALKKAGRNFSGLCPFHSERTPSFIVSPERQTWHCFGACGTGGDAFSFVMKRENVDFAEALRTLAQRAGVTLADGRSPEEDARRQRLIDANEAAASFFHETLLHARTAVRARDYLQERGLDLETVESFQLGYSNDAWDELRTRLTERGFSEEELLTSGLIVEGDRGKHDRFRGRLMFPIHDDRGRCAGFGGRLLETSEDRPSAKYLNSPQTPMFDKGAILYALDKAKEAVRREQSVIVVEGYMDVIAAHQHGMTNVVASMGTALTERQIRALERLRAKILLALDADAAGIEATLRALEEAGEAGAVRAASWNPAEVADEDFSERVREWSRDALRRAAINFYVVPLSGKDPDEMIRKDRAAWDAAIAAAKPFTDHVFDVVAGRHDLSQPSERTELMRALLPVVRLIDEPVYFAHYVQRLARLAQIEEDALRLELRRRRSRAPRRAGAPPVAAIAAKAREPGEEFCLALLLRCTELRHDGMQLDVNVFTLGEHRAIFEAWRASAQLDELREALPGDLLPYLERILQRDLPFLEGGQLREAFADCVRRIELRRLAQAKQASASALSDPDLQPYMSAAVEEAAVLQEARSGDQPEHFAPPPGDPRARELAASIIEDAEMGRKLHGPALRPKHPEPAEVSPQGEVQS